MILTSEVRVTAAGSGISVRRWLSSGELKIEVVMANVANTRVMGLVEKWNYLEKMVPEGKSCTARSKAGC